MIRKQEFTFTTNTAGAATAGYGTSTVQSPVFGELCALLYIPTTIDTGATVTVTCEGYGYSKPLLTKSTAGTSTLLFYPRDLVHAVADGAALTGTSGGDRTEPFLFGQIKIVIASGGAVKTGSVVVFYEE